jgi:hypothetical protein
VVFSAILKIALKVAEKMSFDNPPGKQNKRNYTNKKYKILTLMFLINPSPHIRN